MITLGSPHAVRTFSKTLLTRDGLAKSQGILSTSSASGPFADRETAATLNTFDLEVSMLCAPIFCPALKTIAIFEAMVHFKQTESGR